MVRLTGVCCGLLTFSATILYGLYAQVSVDRIVLRAVSGLFAGLVLGCFAGWVGQFIVNDKASKGGKTSSADAEPVLAPAETDAKMPRSRAV